MTTNQSQTVDILQIKDQVADLFISDLRKQLTGFANVIAIGAFEDKMKKYLLSDDVDFDLNKLDKDWVESIIYFISADTVDHIFDKLKDSKIKIEQAKTQDELENLSAEVQGLPIPHPVVEQGTVADKQIGTMSSQNIPSSDPELSAPEKTIESGIPIVGAIVLSEAALFKTVESSSRINAIEKLGGNETAKRSLKQMAEMFRKSAEVKAIKGPIAAKYLENAKVLEEAAGALNNESLKALDAWKTLGNNPEIARLFALDEKGLNVLSKLGKRDFLGQSDLKKIASMETDEVVQFLKSKGVQEATPELASALKQIKTVKELEALGDLLKGIKGVGKLGKFFKAIPVIDVLILMTVDRGSYNDLVTEAMSIKNTDRRQNALDQADFRWNVDAVQATASAAVGIGALAASLASCGPPGWVVLAAGVSIYATAEAVKYSAKELYFKQRDFFLQNREDFSSKYRTEMKQAIVQSTATIYDGRVEANNNAWANYLAGVRLWPVNYFIDWKRNNNITENMKTSTLDAAFQALTAQDIMLRDLASYPYLWQVSQSNLSRDEYKKQYAPKQEFVDAYTKELKEINAHVDLRMAYIKDYLPTTKGDVHAQKFIQGDGITYIENLLTDAMYYEEMQGDKSYVVGFAGSKDVSAYKEAYKQKLEKDNKEAFTDLEKFFDPISTDPIYTPEHFIELYRLSGMYMSALGDGVGEPDFAVLQERYRLLDAYYHYKIGSAAIEQQYNVGKVSLFTSSYTQITQFLLSLDDKPGIVIAPYYWTKEELPNHFAADKGSFSNETLVINDSDLEISDSVGQNIIYNIAKKLHGYTGANDMLSLIRFFKKDKADALGLYYDDGRYVNVNNVKDTGIADLHAFETKSVDEIMSTWFVQYIFVGASSNADAALNFEYTKKIYEIVKSEKLFQTPEKKKEIKKQIENYVKTYAKEGYVVLPYSVLQDAKKVGLGDMRSARFYYDQKNDTIHICTNTRTESFPEIVVDVTKVQYEALDPVRTELSESEKKCLNYVKDAHTKLAQLMSVEGTWTHQDDLDMPIEIERTISAKWVEREKLEKSLYMYDPHVAVGILSKKYQEYHDYFEGMYAGILAKINTFSTTNDINDIENMEQILVFAENKDRVTYDEKTNTLSIVEGLKSFLSSDQTLIFTNLLDQKLSPYGKSITELAKDASTRSTSLLLAKQTLISIWESNMLGFDGKGNVINISSPTGKFFDKYGALGMATSFGVQLAPIMLVGGLSHLYTLNETQQKTLEQRLLINYSKITTPDLSALDPSTLGRNAFSIHDIDIQKVEASNSANTIAQTIEKTLPLVDRRNERGNISFDHTTNDLESWGYKTRIDANNLSLDGLSGMKFKNIHELLWVANMVNRIKQYKATHDKGNKLYWGSRGGLGLGGWGLYFADRGTDVQLVTSDVLKQNAPTLMNTSNDLDSGFEALLNKI